MYSSLNVTNLIHFYWLYDNYSMNILLIICFKLFSFYLFFIYLAKIIGIISCSLKNFNLKKLLSL